MQTIHCVDCGATLEPDVAEGATDDGKPRCEVHYWQRETARIDARPPRHKRFWHDVTCQACGHEFMADSTSLGPEGCPECGALVVVRRPPRRTLETRVREVAVEVGLDPDAAMGMTFLDFARQVGMRRAVRESERIALSVMSRARAVAP